MKNLFLLAIVFTSTVTFSQLPPPADMASEEQEPYIDTLIEVCNYYLIFNEIKDSIIQDFIFEHELDESKVNSLKAKIQFEYSRFRHSAYNCFAIKSVQELKQMISKYRKLNIQRLTPELKYLGNALHRNIESWIKFSCEEYISEED